MQTLGKWIKGRLEYDGALEIKQPVTKDVLDKYGRNTITLTATTEVDTWYLDFSSPKA